ncbi:MAG: 5-(carboxyamino)imidazole ribonucleotide mutase [Verrucomicrobia bacterium]|nr:5-(carboxyamino)imidazole ribonucleotide mutase [Verrucomicrobiota bacterium]
MSKRKKPSVAILMGSASDWPVLKSSVEVLDDFGVGYDVHVMSAHRTPDEAAEYAGSASGKGFQVVIAAAGMAAHLAGVVAAHTTLPVIGVPMTGGAMDGLDSLLSTVQMPPGVPVATVAIGRAGAINAALLAVQILALSDASLKRKFVNYKRAMKKKVGKADLDIQKELGRDHD